METQDNLSNTSSYSTFVNIMRVNIDNKIAEPMIDLSGLLVISNKLIQNSWVQIQIVLHNLSTLEPG